MAIVTQGQLRFRMEDYDENKFNVISIAEAIEAASKLWSSEGSRQRVRDESECQVIVASSQEIRGIHLDFVEAVVLIGEPESIDDYMHAAGRTCRYQPGSPEPEEGMVVSIVDDDVATKILKWSEISGFKLVEVPLKQNIKTGEPAERMLTARQKREAAKLEEAMQELDISDLDDLDTTFAEAERKNPPSVWS
ncbi:unnamed protein product [Symbiodinium pilosum]|uniref:Helicase C-terminal domain-containing protein n=1 Tax=Symbiodinium pilosum TaxID=2952 RepID=A0A812WB85_SYMPI|nr:unnamed protein product [Symbiodinium pilosum]